jgi:hypothetical protein
MAHGSGVDGVADERAFVRLKAGAGSKRIRNRGLQPE